MKYTTNKKKKSEADTYHMFCLCRLDLAPKDKFKLAAPKEVNRSNICTSIIEFTTFKGLFIK